MNDFQKKLNNCNTCPFEDYDINWYDEEIGNGKLGGYVYPESDHSVMIVGQNPSHRRNKGEHSMKGRQGDIFREIFGKEHLILSNFIQVSTPDNKVDRFTNDQILHCFEHLLFEVENLRPKLIIICSSFAKKKIEDLKLIDRLTEWKSNVVFVKHPDYYFTYNRGNISEYRSELKTIKKKYL